MKLTQLLIIGTVAVTGLAFATAAQADDHRRHNGDRHDYRRHDHYYGQSNYYYQQQGYYDQQPVYVNPGYGYYGGGPNVGVTFAFGGHHSYRHHHHHR